MLTRVKLALLAVCLFLAGLGAACEDTGLAGC
jgi:hypothetical protein